MRVKAFKGGVHPPDRKELSKEKPISLMPLPKRVAVILSQHTGAPASPVVAAKERVVKGQLIAEAQGFVSANIHAPVTGTVALIAPHFTCHGAKVPSIIIDVEESDEEFRLEPLSDPEPAQIVERVKEAGIVGLGGAAFPTHVKLSPPPDYPVDTVIINAAECEPYLTLDYRLMLENTEELVRGAELLKRAVKADRVFFGVEANKLDAAEKIREAVKDYENFEVVVLPTHYPQGSEKHLIKAILGREVPSGGLPFHVGVLVQNVQTAIAVKRAVYDGKTLTERVITVTGSGVNETGNFVVPIGMLASDIIENAGGLKESVRKVIFGGPMTGIALGRLDVPVMKGTSGIVALTEDEVDYFNEADTCIRCARCIEACPMGLEPYLLGTLGRLGRVEEGLEHNLMDCIECGSCSYICPARRNLVQFIRIAKAKSREQKA